MTFFSHMLPLMSASYEADSIVSSIIAFVRLRRSKLGVKLLSWSCDTICASVGVT